MRGIAALSIAIYHYYPTWGGYLAVDFFLVLSGFILSYRYLERPIDKKEFIIRRIARLYPLHIFTLITYTCVYTLFFNKSPQYTDGTLFTLIQHLTMTHNIGLNSSGLTWNFPSWSVSVEFWVNVLFIIVITKSTKSSLLLFISAIALLVIYFNTGHIETQVTNYFAVLNSGLLRGVASFFLGIISYRLYKKYYHEINKGYAMLAELILLVLIICVIFIREDTHSAWDMLAPLLFMALVVFFAFEQTWLARTIGKIKYLGTISYSIYLNQITILILIDVSLKKLNTPTPIIFVTYLLVLLVYSHFTYRYVERPLKKYVQRIGDRLLNTGKT